MKVAVVLSGCGHQDGAEIRESVLCLLELDRNGIEASIFAPDVNQHDVINHIKHSEMPGSRNVMIEAARIARGQIHPLTELNERDFDCLVLPGGFGVAKNLSDLVIKWENASTNEALDAIIKNFHKAKKPIAAVCIAPAIVAISLKAANPKLTLGNESDLLRKIGAQDTKCDSNNFVYDDKNNLLSTPAYMHDDRIANIGDGIAKMMKKLKEIL